MRDGLHLPDELPPEDRTFHSLARAIDGIPKEKHELFLAKLALLLALRVSMQELDEVLAIAAIDL